MPYLIHKMSEEDYNHYLKYHGILGQKWGIRRFQNKDGSLTSAGKERYYGDDSDSNTNNSNNKNLKSTSQLKDDFKDLDYEEYDYNDGWEKNPKYISSVNNYVKIQKLIDEKSGDWYNNKGVSEDFKNQLDKIDKSKQDVHDYENKIEKKISNKYPNFSKLNTKIEEADKILYDLKKERSQFKNIFKKKLMDEKISKEYNIRDLYTSERADMNWNLYKERSKFLETDSKYKQLKNEVSKNNDDLLGVVLKDIGYEDTPEGREYIRSAVFWD